MADAERRLGVLVCGMYFRLRGERKATRGRGQGGGGGKGRKRRLEDLVELKGEARREQISRDLSALSAAEREGEGGWDAGQGAPLMAPYPVPFWSFRPLYPGEWREGTGVAVEQRVVRRRSLRMHTVYSREERMRVLAEASGSFDTLRNLGWGRYIGPRPVLPGRVEEGLDDSGVT